MEEQIFGVILLEYHSLPFLFDIFLFICQQNCLVDDKAIVRMVCDIYTVYIKQFQLNSPIYLPGLLPWHDLPLGHPLTPLHHLVVPKRYYIATIPLENSVAG
jgi:hypothetical protein